MSSNDLASTVCRITCQDLLSRALKLRKTVAGKLLKCVRTVNSIELAAHNLGEKYHRASSEPFFYETAYSPVRRDSVVAVDELGRCCIANEIGQRSPKTNRPEKWECTKECKALTHDEVTSIVSLKMMFTEPLEKLRKALSTMDDGCVNMHFSYLGLDAEHSLELCGHPIPCASGGCGSILRLVRAASVHYPRLRRFVCELYTARQLSTQVENIDAALSNADLPKYNVWTW